MPSPLSNVVQLPAPVGSIRGPVHGIFKGMPSEADLLKIPKARCGEYELSDKECQRLRSQIYSINKHNVVGRRYRTMRDGSLLIVWRIK